MPEVVLIDDDVRRRAVVEETLEAAGFRVHVFGRSAFRVDVAEADRDGVNTAAVILGDDELPAPTAHAVTRWARVIAPLVEAPDDPRTLRHWARWVAVSPSALRMWCRACGVTPRRALVFGRLLRAVCRGSGRHRLANLLNVVDERTVVGLLKLAGFANAADVPATVSAFLERQTLIRDSATLNEVARALRDAQRARRQRQQLKEAAG